MLPILNESFWRDEAFSALLSLHNPFDIIKLTAKDQSPPLYPLILHFWMALFGTTETAIRSLSLLFHFGTVIVAFLLIKKLTKSFTASIFTAGVVLFNPFLLQYAFEARMYTMLAFLSILAVYFIIAGRLYLTSIVLSLALLTHNYAVFTTASIFGWWMYSQKKTAFRKTSELIELFLLPVVTLAAWGTVVWNQWERIGQGFWIKPVTSAIFLETFQSFTQGDLSYPSRHFLPLVSLALIIFAISYWVWRKNRDTHSIGSLLSFAALGPVIISYFISALFAPIFYDRYLIATVPLLIILIGFSLFEFIKENPEKKTMVIVTVSFLAAFLIYASEHILNSYQKPAINWAVENVLAKAQPGDIIIPKDALNFLETKWYVLQSNKHIPIYAYTPTGTVPFYIGSILFDKQEIITQRPVNKRYWEIESDGGYQLVQPAGKY